MTFESYQLIAMFILFIASFWLNIKTRRLNKKTELLLKEIDSSISICDGLLFSLRSTDEKTVH